MSKIEKRVQELEKEINKHRKLYHSKQAEISDEDYDNLEKELFFLDPKNKLLEPDQIGASPNSPLTKVKHKIPMNSLDKINTHDEFDYWFKKYAEEKELCWSLKMDGLSISADFENGVFKQGVTRGDGSEGEDITHTLKHAKFPKKLKKNYTGPIRGEAYFTKANFEKVDKLRTETDEPYANARNAASGTLRRLDAVGCEYLTVVFYQVDQDFPKESDRLKFIESLGLETPEWGIVKTSKDMEDLWSKYENVERKKLDFEIDGIVITCNDTQLQKDLGIVGRKPRYARAYKFSAESAVTQIKEVTPQVGRTGIITPVGEIIPVVVAGATLSRVTLHNYEEIKKLGLKLNQPVLIARKGDVIPKIMKALAPEVGDPIKEPTVCPCCSKKLVREKIFLKCVNKKCPEQVIQQLLFWVEQLEIKGFGYKMVEKLYQAKKLTNIIDFYSLTEKDLSELDRSGDKIAKKLIDQLHEKVNLEPEIFIKALGVENLGEGNSKLILNHFKIEEMFDLTEEDLIKIHGIGPETVKLILTDFKDKKETVEELLKIIKLKGKVEGKLSGKSFCFSGIRDKEMEADLKSHGATISDSVNKALTYLIVLDPNASTGKIEKAKKNKVQILAIDDVRKTFKI